MQKGLVNLEFLFSFGLYLLFIILIMYGLQYMFSSYSNNFHTEFVKMDYKNTLEMIMMGNFNKCKYGQINTKNIDILLVNGYAYDLQNYVKIMYFIGGITDEPCT